MDDQIYVQPPLKYTGLKLIEIPTYAGGAKAIESSLRHVFSQVGVSEGTRLLARINQFKGFDCPGCAWPDPDDDRSAVEFCENGAKAVAEEGTKARVSPDFFSKYSVQQLSTWSDYELGKAGRITHPVKLSPGSNHYEYVSWEDAFSQIGQQLNDLDSPDQAAFYTSGRTSNEAAFMYQLFVRQFGTNNLPDCSNMCHESSGAALTQTVGIGKGSVTLNDFYKTDLIIIIGQNPGTNHPRMLAALEKAKQNGARIITINPLKEAGLLRFKHPQHPMGILGSGTSLTDLYLQVRVNGDVALMKAILKRLLERDKEEDVFDHAFIQSHTSGFDDMVTDLENYSLEKLEEDSGVSSENIQEAVDMIASSEKIIACWAMGLTQHRNAVDNIREVVNLLLCKGSIGKPGAGTCPVRGHSNVQGDRTVGIWEHLTDTLRAKLLENFDFDPPAKDGLDTVGSIEAMKDGKVKAFLAMGGNFLSAAPDTQATAEALMNCDLTVQISTKLNRSHLTHGKTAYILPCLGRTELDTQLSGTQFVTVENSTGVVHASQGGKAPASPHLRSEPAIVAGLANATLGDRTKIPWNSWIENYDVIRDEIERTIPGFEEYNNRVRKPGGFYLPNGAREGKFKTSDQKAQFTVNELPDHELKEEEFLMMTIRSHDQYNTTIYGLNDRYRGIRHERRVVLINPKDLDRFGWKAGEKVDIISEYDGIRREAKGFILVAYDIPTRSVGTYFPEANPVVPFNKFAHTSRTPISKSVIVRLEQS